jgi:hypothetical protein
MDYQSEELSPDALFTASTLPLDQDGDIAKIVDKEHQSFHNTQRK